MDVGGVVLTVDQDVLIDIVVIGELLNDTLCPNGWWQVLGKVTVKLQGGCQCSEVVVVEYLSEVEAVGIDKSFEVAQTIHRESQRHVARIAAQLVVSL